jgi:hypothetical protein
VMNFLQGLNLGVLYLEADWGRHPDWAQRWGKGRRIMSHRRIALDDSI